MERKDITQEEVGKHIGSMRWPVGMGTGERRKEGIPDPVWITEVNRADLINRW